MGLESVILRLDIDMRLYDTDVLDDRADAGDDDRGVETSELELLNGNDAIGNRLAGVGTESYLWYLPASVSGGPMNGAAKLPLWYDC
ncbi:hypothetical protein IMZ48_50105 [Candidatus Bathyarchaeota archaeon]|nr:hypothetical protein [Candidatus Bathyarchaeota archaeon]